jgi:large subunit ribosomal protein L29
MAKTKAKETSQLTADDLQLRLRELKHESLNLRIQRAVGSLENTARIRTVRRETAQVLTAVNAKKNA